MGAFTSTEGLVVSNSSGLLSIWRYRLGGICIFAIFALPVIFKFRPVINGSRLALTMAVLILLTWILASMGRVWFSNINFIASPILRTIAFLILQTVAIRREKRSDSGLGRFLVASAPPFLFLGTWVLMGFWSLAFLMAAVAHVPAVLVTWKSGWGWRLFDIAMLLPTVLLDWFLGMAAWSLAPLQAFHPAKFPLLSALYMAIALIGIWCIFGRRPSGGTIAAA
jgi:hypothetical protein